MNNIKLILFGILIGVGKILPGISGSVIAIMLGVYEKAINCINNPFKKENVIYIAMLSLGFISSVILFSNIIVYLLNHFYIIIMLVFIALLITTSKSIKKKENNYFASFISFLSILIIFISISFLNIKISFNPITLILLGILEGLSMIIPGISGTAILISLNSYDEIMKSFANMNLFVLFYYFIGILMSFLLTARLISNLLKKRPKIAYSIIYGIVLATTVIMIINIIKDFSFGEILLFLIFLTLLSYITKKAINLFSIDCH